MTHLVAKWVLTFATLWLAGCLGTLSGGPIRGQVIDASTHQPLAKAIVVVQWEGRVSSLVDSQSVCYHVETATTDAAGNYLIPRWSTKITKDWEGGIFDKDRSINAYKPGYQRSSIDYGQQENFALEPFKGTVGERIEYLQRIEQADRCSNPGVSEKNQLPFYKSIYEEAVKMAVSARDREIADGFLSWIDVIELGYEQGSKKAIERAEHRKQQP